MKGEGGQSLLAALAAKKGAIVDEWLAQTLRTYPEQTSRFLSQEKDPFRNPVGHTLRAALPALFDALIAGSDAATLARLLDPILRIRAVQDFGAGQAVAFVFLLKRTMREVLGDEANGDAGGESLAAMEARIDEMALLAFDLFMKCREQIYEIKWSEAKRRLFVLERVHGEQTGVG